MSTYGSSGPDQEPATDPWTDPNDQTAPVSPASPPPQDQHPAPPVYQQGHAQPPVRPSYERQPAQYQPSDYQPDRYQPDRYPPNQYHQGYAAPAYAEPAYAEPAYGEPGWQAPAKQRNTAVVVLSIMLAIVVLSGIGVGAYLFLNKSTPPAQAIPSAGQCVRSNNEPEPKTTVSIVTCAPGAYKVLKTITGTDQATACTGVKGMNGVFHFSATNAPLSDTYVLCLGPAS